MVEGSGDEKNEIQVGRGCQKIQGNAAKSYRAFTFYAGWDLLVIYRYCRTFNMQFTLQKKYWITEIFALCIIIIFQKVTHYNTRLEPGIREIYAMLSLLHLAYMNGVYNVLYYRKLYYAIL